MEADTRGIALNMLIRVNEEKAYYHLVLRETLAGSAHLKSRDKAFIKRLTAGTVERRIQLDYIIDLFATVPVAQMKPFIRNLLRMSVYQIMFMDGIPDRAVCDEAIKLAARRGFSSLKGFINGILRNIARKKNDLSWPEKADEPAQCLSISCSMPEWLVKKWLAEYDFAITKAILAGLLETRPVTVRVKGGLTKERIENWLRAVKAAGAAVRPHPYLDYAFEISEWAGIAALPGFKEGFFAVQDVSSMMVCELALIKRGDLVVDVCAAPGGKAVQAAEKAGKVIARDISEAKCDLIRENAARLRQDNLVISVFDATLPDPELFGKADIVLADLPCSGLGVIGRKPDIKYRVSPESLAAICALQRRILAVVWQYVKPGGVLLYSTCTINKDENEAMTEWFSENFPFAREETRQFLPGIHQTDGFFICRLRRKHEQ